jgi:CRISPR/Cas system-associated exonuclease Cas4 (RecB family)
LRFSPSEVSKCARELYYLYTGEEPDPTKPRRPVRARIPDVGNGLHTERQRHLRRMPEALAAAGKDVRFRVKEIDGKAAIETTFEREIEHRGETFKIRGRVDGILEFLDGEGNVIGEAVWDLKVKTLKKKLTPRNIEKEVDKYKLQMASYRVLTDIPVAIIDFESSQKDWSNDGPNADVEPRIIELTDDLVTQLLDKLAYVTQCVRTRTVPEPERNEFYCRELCPFAGACYRDSVAAMKGAIA